MPPPGQAEGRDDLLGGRLHPAAIGVNGLGQLLPLVFVLFAGPFALPLVVLMGAAGVGVAALNWWRFTWRIERDALVIEQGLLQRRRRVIPINRIQSVESVRKLRHRLLGVVALRVESVGGDDSEGQLDALDPQLAERVRAVLLRTATPDDMTAADSARAAPGNVLVRLGVGQLVVAGLTGGRVGVAAALIGFGQELWFDRLVGADFIDALVVDRLARNVTVIVVIAVLALLAVFVVSVLATAVTFWDFTLTRDGDTLGVRHGLLEQRTDTIPLARIQAVRIEQNLLRRVLGLAAVRIEVAGRAGQASRRRQTDVVLPVGPLRAARDLADQIMEAAVTGHELRAMPAAARTRRLVRAAIVTAIACLPAVVEPRALAAALLLVPLGLFAVADYRSLGWAVTRGHVLARRGVFLRRLWIVPAAAVQSVAVTSTPFQRRRDLAALTLHIARSGGAGAPVFVDLARADAQALSEHLAETSTAAGRRQVQQRRADLAMTVTP